MDTQLSSSASPRSLVRRQQEHEGELISAQNNAKQHSKTQPTARNLLYRAVEQLRDPCRFNKFVEDLQKKENKLVETWNDVDRVKHSETQLLNVPVVRAWLEREANPLKANVEKLLNEATTRSNKRCCFVRFPNWIWRYHMAKKLAEKNGEVEKCINEGDLFIKLEDIVSSPDTQNLLPSGEFSEFGSRKDAYEKLLKAMKDNKVSMIGLYGMGGCGKTTMAMELKRTAEAERLFDEVHIVTISNNNVVEVRSIQDKIAKALQIPFEQKEESERAEDLCTRLSLKHKRILLILDDVWQKLDFGAIGIPYGENHHMNCKVLITTRSEAVCTGMDCQKTIRLLILTDEEAWALFRKQARISEGTSDSLKRLGRQISNECKGLPVAISALASTLEGKDEKDWKDALNTLKSPIPMDINDADLQIPYKCLRLSYDNLDSDDAKSLFLLCSVYPEDYDIPLEELTITAIGLGLVDDVQSFEGARDKVSKATKKLISSSLLLQSYDAKEDECVKMHDLVRDVAHMIAGKENKVVKCLLKEDVTTLECSSSSIRYLLCRDRKFPNEVDCSCLELLFISSNFEVPHENFKRMGSVRVLFLSVDNEFASLSAMSLKPLTNLRSLSAMSLKPLTNLRSLSLDSLELCDLSYLEHMTKLESLTLLNCSFIELPDVVVTQMTNLRLLRLLKCRMRNNPFEVIGRHPRLEELYFHEAQPSNADHAGFSEEFSVPQALRRYEVKLGDWEKIHSHEKEFFNGHKTLYLGYLDTSSAAIMDLAEKADVLRVANIKGGGKNFIPDAFQIEGGRNLNYYEWVELALKYSEEIECLVDTRNHQPRLEEVGTLFSKLCMLRIEDMKHFGALYRGVLPPGGVFEKLEQLCIRDCPMLTCVFTPAIARSFVQLKILKISSCCKLKHILADDDTRDEEIGRHDHMLVFSNLKKLYIKHCDMLEYIIPITFAQGLLQLESIYIRYCSELEYVFGQQRPIGDQIQNIDFTIKLPSLKNLVLNENAKVKSIFPSYCCSATWELLHKFRLWSCPNFDIMHVNTFRASNLKISRLLDVRAIKNHFLTSKALHIWGNNTIESIFCLDKLEEIGQPVSLQIEFLKLWDLYQIRYICVGAKNYFTFQNLKALTIASCNKLVVIFPGSVLRFLPELETLVIVECGELKQITEEEDVENQKLSNLVSSTQPYCFPKLVGIFIANCDNLKRLFGGVTASNYLPNLESLVIIGANKLEELIGWEKAGQGDEIGKVKVELPTTLKLLVLGHLPNLSQEIELPTQTTSVVHLCPRLSLTSSIATLREVEEKLKMFEGVWKIPLSLLVQMEGIALEALEAIGVVEADERAFALHKMRGSRERATSHNAEIEASSTHSKSPRTRPDHNIEDKTKEHVQEDSTNEAVMQKPLGERGSITEISQTEIKLRQAETYTDKESEDNRVNIQDFEDDDLVNLLQHVDQEDGDHGQMTAHSVTVSATKGNNLVAKVVADLEECLKMSLKDIASSEASSLRLLTALNFLSHLPSEDVTLSGGLKSIIDSLHQEFPSILCSSKQAFVVTHKFAVLEEKERFIKEELSQRSKLVIKGKEKMVQIMGLEKEIKDCEADLSSTQEEKKKHINVEIVELKKELENVRRDKSQMMEIQRKDQEELFEANHKWWGLCSQFELNRIAARNPS